MNEANRSNKVIALVVACLGSFILQLDASIAIMALPRIRVYLYGNQLDFQWTAVAYILPFAVLMLMFGALGDRFGRKRIFLSGLVLFLIGYEFCGLVWGLGELSFMRALQGVGAAALFSGSLSVLVAAFPDSRERTQALSFWVGFSGMALVIGPLLSGVPIHVWIWPSISFLHTPIGLLTLILAWVGLSESRDPNARRIDLVGQVLVIVGLSCLIIAIIEGGASGWNFPLVPGFGIGAVVFLSAFLVVEARVREPLLPLRLFTIQSFWVATIVALVVGFITLSTILLIAEYFQQVQGYSALDAGLRTFPIGVGAFVMAPFAGMIAGRIGSRLPIIVGALLIAGALFWLAISLEPNSSYGSLWWLLAILGIGLGLMLSLAAAAMFSATPANRIGLGASMFTTSNAFGTILGVAVIGTLALQQFSGNIASQLSRRGVSASVSVTIANRIAVAGVRAGEVSLAGQIPLSRAALYEVISQAFVDALHGSLLISSVCLFVVAVLVAFVFKEDQTATEM